MMQSTGFTPQSAAPECSFGSTPNSQELIGALAESIQAQKQALLVETRESERALLRESIAHASHNIQQLQLPPEEREAGYQASLERMDVIHNDPPLPGWIPNSIAAAVGQRVSMRKALMAVTLESTEDATQRTHQVAATGSQMSVGQAMGSTLALVAGRVLGALPEEVS